MNWVVLTPAWGERHVALLESVVLPAILAAAGGASGSVRFIVHTDQPERLARVFSFTCHGVEFRDPVACNERDSRHIKMSACHRDGVALVADGDCVAIINADMVPSLEVFSAAESRFEQGKRLIICMAPRTIAGDEHPPIGTKSADLLKWAWAHPHQWTTDCIWDKGRSRIPSVLFFERDGSVVMHGFHLHPFAFVKDRPLTFGTTVDLDLAELYTIDEMHVVTSADELSFAEISPVSQDLGRQATKLGFENVAKWAIHTLPMHHWQFCHPIAIVGDGSDIGDRAVCSELLAEIAKIRQPVKSRWRQPH